MVAKYLKQLQNYFEGIKQQLIADKYIIRHNPDQLLLTNTQRQGLEDQYKQTTELAQQVKVKEVLDFDLTMQRAIESRRKDRSYFIASRLQQAHSQKVQMQYKQSKLDGIVA